MGAQQEAFYTLWKVQLGHTNTTTRVKDIARTQCEQRVWLREAKQSV